MTKEWHIWDFPNNIYIQLNDSFKEEFFNFMFKQFGSKRAYARFLQLNSTDVRKYQRGFSYKKGIKYPQALPLSLFKKSLNLMDKEMKINFEKNIYSIKGMRKSNPIIYPVLPIKESISLYRIAAHMLGDGSAAFNKVPYYANSSFELREIFKEDLKMFGKLKIYERETPTVPIVCFPKVVTDILSKILDVKFTNPNRIPSRLFDSSALHKAIFIQALFDDEGTVSSHLCIGMKSKQIIEELKILLEDLNIKTGKVLIKKQKTGDNYTLSIKTSSFLEFKNKIDFIHKEKSHKLDNKIAIMNRNRTERTRPLEWTRQEILNLLKVKPRTTIELSENLLLTFTGVYNHLSYLRDKGIIERGGYKNKYLWKLRS